LKPTNNWEDKKGSALVEKLGGIEEKHKMNFRQNVESLRKYYLHYLEQANFTDLNHADLYRKAILFRGTLGS
jgi:hypothetical protein